MKYIYLTCVVISIITSSCTSKVNSNIDYIYGVSTEEKVITAVQFNSATSKLREVQRLPLGFASAAVVFSKKHQLVYAATNGYEQKDAGMIFAVGADGLLTKKSNFPFHGYSYLSLDRSGDYLLGVSYFTGRTDVYKLDQQGLPSKVSSRIDKTYPQYAEAHAILTSPDNRFAYVPYVKNNNAILQYAFDEKTGEMTPLTPFKAEVGVNAGPRHIAFHPTEPFVYFSNEQQLGVSTYEVTPNGQLTLLQLCSANKTAPRKGLSGSALEMTPNGEFLFSAVRGIGIPHNVIICYKVLKDGTLKPLNETSTEAIPWIIKLSSDANHLLVSSTIHGTLTTYKILPSGTLVKKDSLKWGRNFRDMTVR